MSANRAQNFTPHVLQTVCLLTESHFAGLTHSQSGRVQFAQGAGDFQRYRGDREFSAGNAYLVFNLQLEGGEFKPVHIGNFDRSSFVVDDGKRHRWPRGVGDKFQIRDRAHDIEVNTSNTSVYIGISVGAAVLLVGIGSALYLFLLFKENNRLKARVQSIAFRFQIMKAESDRNISTLKKYLNDSKQRHKFKELTLAPDTVEYDLSLRESVLGRGAAGTVCKGVFGEIKVAVKILHKFDDVSLEYKKRESANRKKSTLIESLFAHARRCVPPRAHGKGIDAKVPGRSPFDGKEHDLNCYCFDQESD